MNDQAAPRLRGDGRRSAYSSAMTPYAALVLVHVLSAFALVLTHGASAAVVLRLRSEREPERIRALLDLSQASTYGFYPAFMLLLITGVIAGFLGDWWSRAWIWSALAIFIAVTLLMYALATRYFGDLRRAAGQRYFGLKDTDPPPPEDRAQLAALAASGRPIAIAWIGGLGLAAIIWLMVAKPF